MKQINYKVLTIRLATICFILLLTLTFQLIEKKIITEEDIYEYFDYYPKINISNSIINKSTITIGNESAQITMLQYIDLESPYSRKFYKKIYTEIKDKYIETGKVKIILIDNPVINIHKNSLMLAQALNCAEEQNKSEIFYEQIFENKVNTKDEIYQLAHSINLDIQKFEYCIQSRKYVKDILDEVKYSKQNDITQNPTVFIGNEKIEGIKPLSEYEEIIEQKLE